MTSPARAMDDLDRLAFRLVRTIRQQFPQLREQGFSLADVEGSLLPFRECRREMADGSAESWEITVLRLISGERAYVEADQELRDACNDSLSQSSPSLSLIRSWPSVLRLGAAALAIGNERVAASVDPKPSTAASRALLLATPPHGHVSCRYCGGRLPDGRSFTFCPHCGLDLNRKQCPACSTSLEVQWRFCVTCGRSTGLPDFPVLTVTPIPKAG